MKSLRDYQHDAINGVFSAIKAGDKDIYIKCGTGGGKTFIARTIIDKLLGFRPDLKFLFVVPKNILLKQTRKEFGEGGIYNATMGERDLGQRITIGSVQSLVNIKSVPRFNVVFFDEVHRAKAQHERLLAKIRTENPKALLIGLTATDYNMNEELGLKKVCDFSLKYLTDLGYLCPLVVLQGEDSLDISKMRVQGDSYNAHDIKDQLEGKIENQVKDMLFHTRKRNKVIIVCTTIEHAKIVSRLIGNCQLYHSRQNKFEREDSLDEWKMEGKYLVSVIAASEGFDYPPADCLVFFRPTRSPTLYEQACGRIARLHPSKKNGLILDYGGVIDSLGLPYDISLQQKNTKSYKECVECGGANKLTNTYCDLCGQAFKHKCKVCEKVLIYGEKCCAREVDRYKNLTEKAHVNKDPFKKLSHITLHKHKSRKGNDCLKVIWWENMFKSIATEYFMFKSQDFKQFSSALFGEVPENPLDLVGKSPKILPKEVYAKKVDGYTKVVSLRFY